MPEADVQQAIAMARIGNKEEARQLLHNIIKADKNNVRAWAALSQLSNPEMTRVYLHEVLRLKPGNEWALEKLADLPTTKVSSVKIAPAVAYTDVERLIAGQKSYVGNAVLVFFLYLLFYIPGLITNFMFLQEAKKTKDRIGTNPSGMGCLQILVITHVIFPAGIVLLLFIMSILATSQ